MATKIITVEATPPAESTGADYYKGAPLNAAEFDQNLVNLRAAVDRKASLSNPTFTGTVVLPATTSIGDVSATELQYLNSVTSNVQDQLNGKQATITTLATNKGGTGLTSFTSGGVVYASSTSALTTGSGLVFDGTNLGIGTASPAYPLQVRRADGAGALGITINSYISAFGRDVAYYAIPDTSTDLAGHTFFVHNGTTDIQAMSLTSSGNLGIGVTPSGWYSSRKAMQLYNGGGIAGVSDGWIEIWGNSYLNSSAVSTYLNNGGATLFQANPGASGAFKWWTAPSGTAGSAITFTERMTLDSSGRLLIGANSTVGALGNITMRPDLGGAGTYSRITINCNQNADVLDFQYNGTQVGRINLGTSATTYVTSSDYRLKEDYRPLSNPIDRVKQLNPVNFAWKSTGERCDGFIAHELQDVFPDAVSGEKDAVDEEGKPSYQGVEYGRITPLLVAALQEAVAKIESQAQTIESLTQRIEALEYTKQGE